MGLMIILGLVGGIIGLFFARRMKASFYDSCFCALVSFGMMAALGSALDEPLGNLLPSKWVTEKTIKLVSLRDKSAIEGSFFLGSGNFNQKEYFVYYREWGTGFKKEKVLAENSIIFEDKEKDPVLIHKKSVYEKEWMNFLFSKKRDSISVVSYEFHVPKGTIIQKFSVE